METAIDILKKNNLSVTDSRKKVLDLFLQQKVALKHRFIEQIIGVNMDRVTIYRTLQVFVTKGIIHTIPTNDNFISYALCKDDCAEGHHHDNHVHFVCDNCGTTTCLDEVTIPKILLPPGFKLNQTEMVVSGVCKDCG